MKSEELKMFEKYRIGVLAGGPSSEREISLKSGKAVFKALHGAGLDAVFMDVNEEGFVRAIDRSGIDVAFITLHGRFGEDGTAQKILEKRNIRYTGSGPVSSALALDKLASKKRFEKEGLKIPGFCAVKAGEDISRLDIRFPCVVKPRCEGSSIGLSVVHSEDLILKAVKEAAEFGENVLIEDFVIGREITVGVLDDRALPVVEIIPADGVYDFEAKYRSTATRYMTPADLEGEQYARVQEAGLKAHRALGCESFSRVDLMLSEEGEIFVLEVNTIPGLTERSLLPMAAKAAGLDFLQLCVKMLCGALSK